MASPTTFPLRVRPHWRRLACGCLAACLMVLPAGCSGQDEAPSSDRDAARIAPADGGGDQACPALGRRVEVMADMGLFRARQRAEREAMQGERPVDEAGAVHKERRAAEEDRATGDEETAKAQPRSAKKPGTGRCAASGKSPAPGATGRTPGRWTIAMVPSRFPQGTLARARDQFSHFTGAWLDRIRENMRYSEGHAEIVRNGRSWLARFTRLDPASRQLEVKATDTPDCPFVGVLRYLEHHYEAAGPTPDLAASGPFRRVKTVRVTEIFRYGDDAWVH